MTAALKAVSGSVSAPGFSFSADATAGLYLSSTGIVGLVAKTFGLLVDSAILQATTATVQAGGSGYAVGDTITLTGGTAINQPVLTVATLSGTAVATVTVSYPGNYTVTPANPVSQGSTSGAGTSATFNVAYIAQFSASVVTDEAGRLPWQRLGSSSFVSGLMAKANGLDFATGIGASNIAAAIGSSFLLPPGGRLSNLTGTPVLTADSTGATSVFWNPYNGNGTPIYNGTNFVNVVSNSQLTLTLSNTLQASGGIYDVYKFLNAGVATLAFGVTWSAGTSGSVTLGSCVRGTGASGSALTSLNGIWVNAVSTTMNNGASTFTVPANQGTYLGSVYINSTAGQTNCHISPGQSRQWGVWNVYNRVLTDQIIVDSTASWTNAATSWGPSNGDATNCATTFCGLPEEWTVARFTQVCFSAIAGGGTSDAQIGWGFNVTNAVTGQQGEHLITSTVNSTIRTTLAATANISPRIGINKLTCINQSANGATLNTYAGTSSFMNTNIEYRS